MISSLNDFQQLLKLMRENNVEYAKLGEVEVRLSAEPQEADLDSFIESLPKDASKETAEDFLYWSAGK